MSFPFFFSRTPSLRVGSYGPPFFPVPVRLPLAELRTHLWVSGVTGVGKSRWLAHLALTLLARGEGITLLDPHGDTVRLVMDHLIARGVYADPGAYARITYLDLPTAARQHRYAALDLLDQPTDAPTTARLVLEALQRAWPGLDGGVAPAFENAVLAGVAVLIHHHLPLPLLGDLFLDAPWRAMLLADVRDPAVRGFFTRLAAWGSREQAQYLESTLRRVFLLGFSPVLRYSLGQAGNVVGAFRARMDAGQSLLVNLALPDADSRRLLGSILTVLAEQGALGRAGVPAGERGRGHTLIVDEYGEVAAQSGVALTHILEQCRKFGLALVVSNQGGAQLDPRVGNALEGAGTRIVFRQGRRDAEVAAKQLARPSPTQVKHLVLDRVARRRTHPQYASLGEQWESWASSLTGIAPRMAYLRRGNGRVIELRTPAVPDPVVDPARREAVEDHYLTTLFTAEPVVAAELVAKRGRTSATPATTRRRGRVAQDAGDSTP